MAEDVDTPAAAPADQAKPATRAGGLDVQRDRVAEQHRRPAAMAARSERDLKGAGDDARNDEDLMVAFAHGEPDAFAVLVRRHQRGLYNFLLRSVGDAGRAEELLQDVFVRVIRSKHRYQQTAKFTTWVYKIARNITIDESRRAKFRRHASLDAKRRRGAREGEGRAMIDRLPADQVGTDTAAAGPTIQRRISEAVAELPEEQRVVFLMRQLKGMSFKQIGEVVGAPENTVKSRMRYALEKLRQELSDMDPREAQGDARPGGESR